MSTDANRNHSSRSAPPLDAAERVRGRRLAIGSHLSGMVFANAFSGHLATLALISVGAGEALVGLHNGLSRAVKLLELPTFRAMAVYSKRQILVAGHLTAMQTSCPPTCYPHGYLYEIRSDWPPPDTSQTVCIPTSAQCQ